MPLRSMVVTRRRLRGCGSVDVLVGHEGPVWRLMHVQRPTGQWVLKEQAANALPPVEEVGGAAAPTLTLTSASVLACFPRRRSLSASVLITLSSDRQYNSSHGLAPAGVECSRHPRANYPVPLF